MLISVKEIDKHLIVTKVNIWTLTTHSAYGNVHLHTGAKVHLLDSIGDDGHKLFRDFDVINYLTNDIMAIISFQEETKYDRFLIEHCNWDISIGDETFTTYKVKFTVKPEIIYDGSKDLEHTEYNNNRVP